MDRIAMWLEEAAMTLACWGIVIVWAVAGLAWVCCAMLRTCDDKREGLELKEKGDDEL